MSKIKLDLNSEQNILNMLMESSSISEDQMSKINANSKEIGKTKLETAIELNFIDEEKIKRLNRNSNYVQKHMHVPYATIYLQDLLKI